MSATLLFIRW